MTKRSVLAIHDISCVGRCSLTVALPIVSAVGLECSVLPTAVLSTHTGGFQGFTYRDLTEDMLPIREHWKSLGLQFDSYYTGFLGSDEQIGLVIDTINELSSEETKVYVDPVMGDNGLLYTIFDRDFPKKMRRLSERADVLMPNLTELCMMLDIEYRPGPYTQEYIDSILEASKEFGLEKIVITGVSFDDINVGAVYYDYETGEKGSVMRIRIEGYYHGTGDVFGSVLVGCLESGLSLKDSVRTAVDFTVEAIQRTHASGADVRYGVDFEPGLRELANNVQLLKDGIGFESVTTELGISRVAGLAAAIWCEAYEGIVDEGQIEYMLRKFQSPGPLAEAIEDGCLYFIIKHGKDDIGYIGARLEADRMFLSKAYLSRAYRGHGLLSRVVDFLKGICRENGAGSIYLTVKRTNERAIKAYQAVGFVITNEVDNPIGDGYEMNDYVMEAKV